MNGRKGFSFLAHVDHDSYDTYDNYCTITDKTLIIRTENGSYISDYKTVQFHPIRYNLFYDGYGYLYEGGNFHRIKNGQIEKSNMNIIGLSLTSYDVKVNVYGNQIILILSQYNYIHITRYDRKSFINLKKFTVKLNNPRIGCAYDFNIIRGIIGVNNENETLYINGDGTIMTDSRHHFRTISTINNIYYKSCAIYINDVPLEPGIILLKINLLSYNDTIFIIDRSIYNYRNQLLCKITDFTIMGLTNTYIIYSEYQNPYRICIDQLSYVTKRHIIKKNQNTEYKHILRLF